MGELAPEAGEAAEQGLSCMVVGVEGEENDEAEDILRKARTGAGHAAEAKRHSKGPGAARAGNREQVDKGAGGAPGCVRDGGLI